MVKQRKDKIMTPKCIMKIRIPVNDRYKVIKTIILNEGSGNAKGIIEEAKVELEVFKEDNYLLSEMATAEVTFRMLI